MTYSDETLTDYLNGTASAEDAAGIEAALETDQALERRLMALDTAFAGVADVFKGIPGTERLERLRADLPVETARPARWQGGAAIAASLALGVLVGSQFLPSQKSQAADWHLEVARYTALYVPETVAFLDAETDNLTVELGRASDALGLDLDLGTLAEVGDLTLRRAQILGFEGQPLIQLAYTDAAGAPFALCIMPDAKGTKGAQQLAGLATHAWGSGSHGFILVGGTSQDTINGLADQFQAKPLQAL